MGFLRKSYSVEQKVKVALEILKEEKSVTQHWHSIIRSTIHNYLIWKKQVVEGLQMSEEGRFPASQAGYEIEQFLTDLNLVSQVSSKPIFLISFSTFFPS